MARINKSENIRAFLKANPDATHDDVVKGLANMGINVKAKFVSDIKSMAKRLGQIPQVVRQGQRSKNPKRDNTVELLLDVKRIASKWGTDKVGEALSTYKALIS